MFTIKPLDATTTWPHYEPLNLRKKPFITGSEVVMQTIYYVAGSFAAIGTLVAAIIAVCVYHRNWRLEQSRWASSFYEKFYESEKYKAIREKLDRSDEASISSLVEAEEAEFTDYLNFFEHVAIFAKSKQLKKDDVEASFAYLS